MPRIDITDLSNPYVQVFSRMTDAELRDPKQLFGLSRALPKQQSSLVEQGLFIAESYNVIERALDADLSPFALLTEQRWVQAGHELLTRIEQTKPAVPLFVGTHEEVRILTGYERTRGPLAAFYRPVLPHLDDLLDHARRIAILEDITNFTNIGAIFRSAAALGVDAILVTPGCHDPLYRRAARVSMGTVFQIPWTRIGTPHSWPHNDLHALHEKGFTVAALALNDQALSLKDPRLVSAEKLALLLGTEGEGLKSATIDCCDCVVKIPMYHGVDSLNVAAASAVAFWELCAR